VHEDTIYYWYDDSVSEIVIVGLAEDGISSTETRIAVDGRRISAGGLRITDNGNFAIIISSHTDDGNIITYGIYNREGILISAFELSGVSIPGDEHFRIEHVVYSGDGNIALVAGDNSDISRGTFLFDGEGASLGWLDSVNSLSMISLHDGCIVVLFRNTQESYLREIDFTAGKWGDTIALKTNRIRNLIPTVENQPFDFLADDGRYIIGYTLDSDIQTPLLDWLEMRPISFAYTHTGSFSDGRPVIMFNPVYIFADRSITWNTDIFVFTPVLRTEVQNRTVLTIGGIWIPEEIRNEVIMFNRENRDYQIELRDYGDSDTDIDVSKAHFLIDMLTGQGPDIIVDAGNQLGSHDYLIDLYPLIDADSEINRSDFFQNVLSALEAPGGTLPIINNVFIVSTMIAMRETASMLEPFTLSGLRKLFDEPDAPDLFGMRYPYRCVFIVNSVLLSNGDFIDWSNGIAKFDISSFVDLLEISAHLPSMEEVEEYFLNTGLEEEERYWEGLRNGHILLHDTWIANVTGLQELHVMLGDIVAVGIPTENGGRHVVMAYGDIGISNMSEHREAAWSFVRRLLLPDVVVPPYALPLRIDLFEEQITEAMTPRIVDGVEQSVTVRQGHHTQVQLYAMTEDEAADLRALVTNADMPFRYDEAMVMIRSILLEESQRFFDGQRTAEATARIIQSRVQAYLDER
jgi:ABC-type glycerol-3-phosphate transport system substrate-binding protein